MIIKDKKVLVFAFMLVGFMFTIVCIGQVYLGIPASTIVNVFVVLSVVCSCISKLFRKNRSEPITESIEDRLIGNQLDKCALIACLAVVVGIIVGFYVFGQLIGRGSNPSPYWILFILVGYPSLVAIIYLMRRSAIIKQMPNKAARPER